jgi:hypothetical protein
VDGPDRHAGATSDLGWLQLLEPAQENRRAVGLLQLADGLEDRLMQIEVL